MSHAKLHCCSGLNVLIIQISTFSDICKGHCRHHTGVYADPYSRQHYVQCGFDFIHSRRCHCCKQHSMRCPDYTEFNDDTKQCVATMKKPLLGRGYKYGYYWCSSQFNSNMNVIFLCLTVKLASWEKRYSDMPMYRSQYWYRVETSNDR